MSRSPSGAGAGGTGDYLRAFETVYRLHEEGRSFSGRERHCAFLNPGAAGGPFATVSAVTGLDLVDDGRAVAAVDWDHDGDLDLWIANRTAPQLRFLRNDRPADGRFLAVLLAGTTSNRDAVGAQAELFLRPPGEGSPARLVRTRYAGHGFLAQSSSWLHFGLGRGGEIDRLEVRWPGGGRETFTGLKPGRHYRIVEGGGAEPWEPPAQRTDLPASGDLVEQPATPERAVLVGRPPLPLLAYRGFAGETVDLDRGMAGPTLLNLWASWCLPCAAELRELDGRSDELRAAGLQVIALSVDGLDPEKSTSAADARAFVDRVFGGRAGAAFTFGLARPELLDKLQLLLDRMFSRRVPLAVPTSLLVDAQGRLAAVYRGPVDVDLLLGDARNLEAGLEARRARATPLAGRWFAPPQALSLETVAKRFAVDGYTEDAGRYLRAALAERGGDAELHRALGDLLLRQGDLAAATEHYRDALRLEPGDGRAARIVADLLVARGSIEEALDYYAKALAIGPEATTRFNYGNALQQLGRTDEAIAQYRAALAIDGEMAGAHNNLGALLLGRGDAEGAAKHFARALELDPDDANARKNLGIARRALEGASH